LYTKAGILHFFRQNNYSLRKVVLEALIATVVSIHSGNHKFNVDYIDLSTSDIAK
jgi:hypothetical protein